MSLIYSEEPNEPQHNELSEAQQQFQRASSALNKLVGELDDGELGHVGEAKKILEDLKQALRIATQERERLESERKKRDGIVHDYAIDFDAARSEIGRRLACLRTAGGSGSVPE
jgi:tryptophanyl-tRNA synthetase